jgi:hypothetical protein
MILKLALGLSLLGSAQEFVKVLNWRGFLKPRASEFRGWVCDHAGRCRDWVGAAMVTDLRPPGAVSLSWEVTSKALGSRQEALI